MTELRRALPFLLLPLLLLAAGCGLLPRELTTLPTAAPGGEARAALQAASLAWADAGIDSHEWQLDFQCFCGVETPVTVTVVDGVVADVRSANGRVARDRIDGFPLTVEALFEREAAVLDRGGTVDATYAANGVPIEVGLDPIINAIDDELTIVVMGFTPAP